MSLLDEVAMAVAISVVGLIIVGGLAYLLLGDDRVTVIYGFFLLLTTKVRINTIFGVNFGEDWTFPHLRAFSLCALPLHVINHASFHDTFYVFRCTHCLLVLLNHAVRATATKSTDAK
jgi:hypothetical protein